MPAPDTAFRAPASTGRAPCRGGSVPKNALRDAFLAALADRVAVNRGGRVTLPTGIVDAGEVADILTALDRARADGGRG